MLAIKGISCFFVFLLVGAASAQSDFSAEIVDVQKPGTPTLARVYFANDKRRIEMQTASGDDTIMAKLDRTPAAGQVVHVSVGGGGDTIILDLAAHTSAVLWPTQKTYARAKDVGPAELYGLYAYVHPADVDNACVEWMHRPGAEGETCRNLGHERLNGRDTVKYELSCYGEVCRLWIDRKLRVLIKRESKWNSTELRNICEEPQLPSLFDVPDDYSSTTLSGTIRPTEPQ
jgi:hypothetical protein